MARWWRNSVLLLLSVTAAACGTKSNPAATCSDNGQCSDPSFPFCDVDGSVDGVPNSCVAFTCRPGQLDSCSGSDARVCNATGTSFDLQTCANGCDDQAGCRACLPNQTSCVGDMLSTCDAAGNVASSTACALGCTADGTRCNVVVPSNGVQVALDMDPSPPDIDLENGVFDPDNETFTPTGGSAMAVPTVALPAQTGGFAMRVLVANRVTFNNVTLHPGGGTITLPSSVLVVLAKGAVTVNGVFRVRGGTVLSAGCRGGAGDVTNTSAQPAAGGGGGGFGTSGASGGAVIGSMPESGGAAGGTDGNEALIPLRGGCLGGGAVDGSSDGGDGGGAVQITSLTSINILGTVSADAPIPVSRFGTADKGAGGGAGGGLLLEAPRVTVAGSGRLFARGSGGTAADGTTGSANNNELFQPGGSCGLCGANGGDGASPTVVAQPGKDFSATNGNHGGGGGGGLGRIRVNTADGSFAPASQALVAGVVSTGVVSRR